MRTFLNCDCFDFLRTIPDESVDVILTDPPYYKIVKNEWDNQFLSMEHFQKWCECLALEFTRVLKPNGSFFGSAMTKTLHIVRSCLINILNF